MSKTFVFSTISGGYFVSQTAILNIVMSSINNVDAYFGNSGGAIANLISLKYSGSSKSMEKVLYSIDKEIFIKKWVTDNHPLSSIISPVISLVKNSFYRESSGSRELIDAFFTPSELKDTEFWIGKYNITSNFNHILTTRGPGQSIFNTQLSSASQNTYLEDMTGTFTVEYADGDIGKISKTLDATSAIPGYKPPVTDDNGNHYVDGGVGAPTPGTSMNNIIVDYALNSAPVGDKFHIFYVIGPKYIDEGIEDIKPTYHWIKQIMKTTKAMLNFSIYRERQLIFDSWIRMTGNTIYTDAFSYRRVSGSDLKSFLDSINNKHYFVTCYSDSDSIDIVSFVRTDLEKEYKKSFDKAFFEIFYI